MLRRWIERLAACAALLAAVTVLAGPAFSQDGEASRPKTAPPPPGGNVTGFYGGQVAGGQGAYTGKLVCLRNDQRFAVAGAADECPSGRRVYALERSDGETIHPLLANDEQLMNRFDQLRGKDVRVEGKLYEATGMILVSAIADE
jgi:hypothetical protein